MHLVWVRRKRPHGTRAYEAGVARETAGSYREALAAYQEADRIDPHYADLQFRMGTCDLALTNYDQARRDFELATDYDALAFRADTTINQAIKAAAARHAGQGVYPWMWPRLWRKVRRPGFRVWTSFMSTCI